MKILHIFWLLIVCLTTLHSVSAQTTIRLKPLNSADDAEQDGNGNMYLNSDDLELASYDWGNNFVQMACLRFPNVALPQGATITKAYIQFSVKETYANTSNAANINIFAQKGDAAAFTTVNANITSRPFTSAYVNWVTNWTVADERLAAQQTPDLKTIINEARATNFVSGNALVFAFAANTSGYATVASFDRGNAAQVPELVIEYKIPTPENIDLFIWAGQSNAQGWQGDGAQYPTNAIDSAIRLNYTYYGTSSSNGEWINMQTQSGLFANGHFGPEVTFSRRLKENGYNPAIFKFAKGSTGLAADWKATGQGGIYDAMVVAYKAAIKKLEDAGHTVSVRGFVWIQGESDAYSTAAVADAYQVNLTTLINDVRLIAKNSCLPIILGVDEQFPSSLIGTVVQAQKNVVASTSKSVFTSMIGLQKADVTHLTPSGLLGHGYRIYEGYTSIVPDPISFFNCTTGNQAVISNTLVDTYYSPFNVALTGTSGATVRYTTDGSTPTAATGTLYTIPIAVNAATTIKAISVSGTQVSPILVLPYTLNPPIVISDKEIKTYNAPFSVTLMSHVGATIRYTINGSTPTAATGTVYSAPIAVNSTTTIKAVCVIGTTTSAVLTLPYVIN